MTSQEDIQFLSSEQLHADLVELKSAFNDKLSTLGADIADNIPQIDEVTVKNQPEPFNGEVVVQNNLKAEITNINQIVDKLTTLISTVDASKTKDVSINNPVFIKNLGEVSELLNKLLAKETSINVAAPIVKLNTPSSITIGNFPTNPKDAIAVRLTDGSRFIEQLTRVVASGGGGSGTPYTNVSGSAIKVVLESDGSIPITVKSVASSATVYSKPTDNYSLTQYDDTSSATYEYYAYMDKDTNWYIKRITLATNLIEFTVPVATLYATGWTGRAALTFLTYGGAF